jgi:hypothetical protein
MELVFTLMMAGLPFTMALPSICSGIRCILNKREQMRDKIPLRRRGLVSVLLLNAFSCPLNVPPHGLVVMNLELI